MPSPENQRRSRVSITYQGVTYSSYADLARRLAAETGAKFHQIRKLLSAYSGDVDRVVANLNKQIIYDGVAYSTRHALAQGLAKETGAKFHQIRNLLSTYSGDVERVLAHLRRYNGTGITVEYKGVTYRSKRALAKVLAAEFDANRQNIQTMLSVHDVEYVVERLQNPKAIIYDGVTYSTRRALAQVLAGNTGAKFQRIRNLLTTCNDDVEQVLARLQPTKSTTYKGEEYYSYSALARHLAKETGGNCQSIRWQLWACGGDVEHLLTHLQRRAS
jgi:hypothetical protein